MAKKKRVTSQQVAERAGVSRTTVSLILNRVPGPNFTEETRQRVFKAAEELGYVPHEAARSLASGKTRNIGLIICQPRDQFLSDAFIPNVIYGINELATEHGFNMLIDWVEDVAQPGTYEKLTLARKIDGIILALPRSDDEEITKLIDDGFPVVLLGNTLDTPGYAVGSDDYEAACKATEHLINLGHKRIGCITNGAPAYLVASERLRGYCEVLEAKGIIVDEQLISYGAFTPESGYQAMQSLLTLNDRPTAVFVASDAVAFGAMTAIHEHGLRIPQDVAVVGIDDIAMARYATPPLTTIRLSAPEQGRQAMAMLVALMEGNKPPESKRLIKTELIIRQSCGAKS
ncbi:MAG: LacI family transcriptional regulator [Chloroflexi bacterium]|nr:MAG: LacI family transcriptional regulator [Phototrophicales bacterium]RMF80722.1 MAG: LacI family transcriptional regulator [Chloroflexota bacterium]